MGSECILPPINGYSTIDAKIAELFAENDEHLPNLLLRNATLWDPHFIYRSGLLLCMSNLSQKHIMRSRKDCKRNASGLGGEKNTSSQPESDQTQTKL